MNVQTKNLKHYSEPGNRCLAEYFRIYLEALDSQGPFYRRPLPGTPERPIRYGTQVVGINKIKTFMKSIAKKEGLQWNYTNHSGKKTCATQLYVGGVPEADIMSVTGHRSQQGVRKYMRSNVDTKKKICMILGPPISTSEESLEPSKTKESLEPSSSSQGSLGCRKRPLSPVNSDNFEDDAKRFCPENQHILKKLSNTASVFNNCQFSFSFGPK